MSLEMLRKTVVGSLIVVLWLGAGVAYAGAGETITVRGMVESVLASKHKVKITHEAAPEWGSRKMRMKFDVSRAVDEYRKYKASVRWSGPLLADTATASRHHAEASGSRFPQIGYG